MDGFAAAYAAKLRLKQGKSYVGESKPEPVEALDMEPLQEEAIEPEPASEAPPVNRVAQIVSSIRRKGLHP